MQATISRWGNSLALRLPRHIIEQARLVEGAPVNIEIDDGAIRVTPSRKRFRLSELLEGERPAGFDWGDPSGEESW